MIYRHYVTNVLVLFTIFYSILPGTQTQTVITMDFQFNVDTIILYVQDLERLTSFYTQIFKFDIIEAYPSSWVLLNAGNAKIGLHQAGRQWLDKNKVASGTNSNTKIVFELNEDINRVRGHLIDQQVSMGEIKTFDNYDYWLCDGEDPEGNVFQLKQRK